MPPASARRHAQGCPAGIGQRRPPPRGRSEPPGARGAPPPPPAPGPGCRAARGRHGGGGGPGAHAHTHTPHTHTHPLALSRTPPGEEEEEPGRPRSRGMEPPRQHRRDPAEPPLPSHPLPSPPGDAPGKFGGKGDGMEREKGGFAHRPKPRVARVGWGERGENGKEAPVGSPVKSAPRQGSAGGHRHRRRRCLEGLGAAAAGEVRWQGKARPRRARG